MHTHALILMQKHIYLQPITHMRIEFLFSFHLLCCCFFSLGCCCYWWWWWRWCTMLLCFHRLFRSNVSIISVYIWNIGKVYYTAYTHNTRAIQPNSIQFICHCQFPMMMLPLLLSFKSGAGVSEM